MLDEQSEIVFVGGKDMILKQFNLQTGKLIEEYPNMGVGNITHLSLFVDLLFVGGNNHHCSFVDIQKGEVLTTSPVKTSVQQINTSQFCVDSYRNNLRVSLFISGSNDLYC